MAGKPEQHSGITPEDSPAPPVVKLNNVSHRYKKTVALNSISIDIPAGKMIGFIGPDGVGKSTALSLIAGATEIQTGSVEVLGNDMRSAKMRAITCPRIAYMAQGLGKNLYLTLSVYENISFFGKLFGHSGKELNNRIAYLLNETAMAPFADRPAGKLSGGMKQKLSLCCALIHDPDLLILDEPTTGVDPLSRRQFWDLITSIRIKMPNMSVLIATAYMEEASQYDWLVAMDDGNILATGSPSEFLEKTGTDNLDKAFIELLPEAKKSKHIDIQIPPLVVSDLEHPAIEATHLTKRFGNFTAVEDVSFKIPRGEIFGFLGSNGCGKSTTMKMLTGLLDATEGDAHIFGQKVVAKNLDVRRRVGYMSQAFSLNSELNVRQNLELHANLFDLPKEKKQQRIREVAETFELVNIMDAMPNSLPLGIKQRLSLAVAVLHSPEILILDEPTSGVDPIARDALWNSLIKLSREDKVTIFISTHFMNEAERCDRISLMHAGKVLVSDTPGNIRESRHTQTLEEAFIGYLEDASTENVPQTIDSLKQSETEVTFETKHEKPKKFDLRRLLSYSLRESMELKRDSIRATLALVGSFILMIVIGYGINMDVDDLTYAVLDFDHSVASENYKNNLAGSRYFIEKKPIANYKEMDERMRSADISLAIEIPPEFGKNIAKGNPVEVGAWVDGAMPQRAETLKGYVQGIHSQWLIDQSRTTQQPYTSPFNLEIRYRYNPDVKSLPAMVPAVIPILLMMIPSMLTALSVVREKELGSIVNLYVTPVSRLEFLLGKQLPYIGLAYTNYLLLVALAVFAFDVPITGSFLTLSFAALLYVIISTGLGLFISTFTSTQIASIFATAVLTLIPVVSFSGMLDPVSSLEGGAAFIGKIYPATYFIIISRGTFSKALNFPDLQNAFLPLIIAIPVIIASSVLLLRKQAK